MLPDLGVESRFSWASFAGFLKNYLRSLRKGEEEAGAYEKLLRKYDFDLKKFVGLTEEGKLRIQTKIEGKNFLPHEMNAIDGYMMETLGGEAREAYLGARDVMEKLHAEHLPEIEKASQLILSEFGMKRDFYDDAFEKTQDFMKADSETRKKQLMIYLFPSVFNGARGFARLQDGENFYSVGVGVSLKDKKISEEHRSTRYAKLVYHEYGHKLMRESPSKLIGQAIKEMGMKSRSLAGKTEEVIIRAVTQAVDIHDSGSDKYGDAVRKLTPPTKGYIDKGMPMDIDYAKKAVGIVNELVADEKNFIPDIEGYDRKSSGFAFRKLNEFIAEVEKDNPKETEDYTILDAGCGTGHVVELLDKIYSGGCRVVGIDIDPEMIDFVRRKGRRGEYRVDDIMTLSTFDDESVNAIWCSNSANYTGNLHQVAETFSRVLKDNGVLFLRVPSERYFKEKKELDPTINEKDLERRRGKPYSLDEVRDAFDPYFNVLYEKETVVSRIIARKK